MSVRVTIEASSRAEAELIAQRLPSKAQVQVQVWRGMGVIRLGSRSRAETDSVIDAVSQSFHEHSMRWARVRYDDEERVFRANGHRRPDQSTTNDSGSAKPAIR